MVVVLFGGKEFRNVFVYGDRFDPLNESHIIPAGNPVVCKLKAAKVTTDERKLTVYVNHCVCFVGEYMFDSNLPRALPINRMYLDAVVASISPGAFYDGIYWARELAVVPRSNIKRM
jgi:hypothetical protein